MKIGSLVELVDDNWSHRNKAQVRPIKNKIYTIRDIGSYLSSSGEIAILLVEIVNNKRVYSCGIYGEPSWRAYRFRELIPPIANIEEHINANTLEPELCP